MPFWEFFGTGSPFGNFNFNAIFDPKKTGEVDQLRAVEGLEMGGMG
jgi:hypothetical protein